MPSSERYGKRSVYASGTYSITLHSPGCVVRASHDRMGWFMNSGQPYPASLMVGFYATADSSQPLRKDLDNELEGEITCPISASRIVYLVADAQWWTREQVLQVLSNAAGTNLTDKDHSRISEAQEQQEQHDHEALKSSTANARAGEALPKDGKAQVENSSASGLDEVPFRIPPLTAVAGVLVNEWAYRRAGPGSGVAGQSK